MKQIEYCNNDPCETEAMWFYVMEKGGRFYLCTTCMEAFELGQINKGAEMEAL